MTKLEGLIIAIQLYLYLKCRSKIPCTGLSILERPALRYLKPINLYAVWLRRRKPTTPAKALPNNQTAPGTGTALMFNL